MKRFILASILTLALAAPASASNSALLRRI